MKKLIQGVSLLLLVGAALQFSGCATTRQSTSSLVLVAEGTDTLYVDHGSICMLPRGDQSLTTRMFEILVGPSVEANLGRPTDVCVDENNRVYVCDGDLSQVLRFDSEDGLLGGCRFFRNPEFATPTGVEIFPLGVAIADAGRSQVFLMKESGRIFDELDAPEPWIRPGQMHWDGDRLFVCDAGRHVVEVFNGKGKHLQTLGQQGSKLGEFLHPLSVTSDSEGQIWVLDALNHRVQAFSSDLYPIRSIGAHDSAPGGFMFPKSICFDTENNLYVCDAGFNRVQVFSRTGALLYWFGETGHGDKGFLLPSAMHADGNRLYLADQFNRCVRVMDYLPMTGSDTKELQR
jgi:DNA-binding beta-propeller fold protein YncE